MGILANQLSESQSVPLQSSPLQYFTESVVKHQLFSVLVATQLGDWASRPTCSISRSETTRTTSKSIVTRMADEFDGHDEATLRQMVSRALLHDLGR